MVFFQFFYKKRKLHFNWFKMENKNKKKVLSQPEVVDKKIEWKSRFPNIKEDELAIIHNYLMLKTEKQLLNSNESMLRDAITSFKLKPHISLWIFQVKNELEKAVIKNYKIPKISFPRNLPKYRNEKDAYRYVTGLITFMHLNEMNERNWKAAILKGIENGIPLKKYVSDSLDKIEDESTLFDNKKEVIRALRADYYYPYRILVKSYMRMN